MVHKRFFGRYGVIVLALIAVLVLAACGGDDSGDDGDDGGDADAGNGGEAAALEVTNLDAELVLDATGTLAEDEGFENFVISYPDNWHAEQDGFEMTISNNPDVTRSHGFILAGSQEIPEGAILINALTQGTVQYSGVPVEDATTAEEMLSSYLTNFGITDAPVPYEELEGLTAYRYVSVDGVEQFFPAGTVLVTVEYEGGMALYQVIFDGSIQEYEPIAREIIANATITG